MGFSEVDSVLGDGQVVDYRLKHGRELIFHYQLAGIRVEDIRVAVDTPGDKQIVGAEIDTHPERKTVIKALDTRDGGLSVLLGNPVFDNLTSDARYHSLVEKLGLLRYWQEMNFQRPGLDT